MLRRTFLGMSLLAVSVNAHDTQVNKKVETIYEQELRGFFSAKLLYGLAATCEQVGRAATEQDPQEKVKAAFGIVSAMLSVAADVVEEHETSKKDKAEIDQKKMSTRMAILVCQLADHVAHHEIRSGSEVRYEILVEIGLLQSFKERLKAVKDHFSSLEKAQALLKEVCSYIKIYVEDTASALFEHMQAVKEKLVNRSDIGHVIEKEQEVEEELAPEVVGLAAALWQFFGNLASEKDAIGFLKIQGALLFDFVYTLFIATIKEEIEDRIEDSIKEAIGLDIDLNGNGR